MCSSCITLGLFSFCVEKGSRVSSSRGWEGITYKKRDIQILSPSPSHTHTHTLSPLSPLSLSLPLSLSIPPSYLSPPSLLSLYPSLSLPPSLPPSSLSLSSLLSLSLYLSLSLSLPLSLSIPPLSPPSLPLSIPPSPSPLSLSDMAEVERNVRSIEKDGLLWGASKLVPVAYGIKKLQISCVVEDEKVSRSSLFYSRTMQVVTM